MPFDGGEFGGQGMMGDREFDEKAQTQRMEEQEKRMQAQMLSQMKRQMSGLDQGIKMTKRVIDRLKKKNIPIPGEAEDLIRELTAAFETIKNATEFSDSVESAMEVVQEKGPDLSEWGPRLGMLEGWSKTVIQVEKEMMKLDKVLAKAKKRKEAGQYPEIVAKLDAEVAAVKLRWSEMRNLVAGGDIEEVMSDIQDMFESINEAHHAVGFLQQVGQVAKMIKNGEKEIASFEKRVTRLEKSGKNVSSIRNLTAEVRAKLAEIKALSATPGSDPEEFFDLMQELEPLRNRAYAEFDRINGKSDGAMLSGAVIQALSLRRVGF